MSEVEDMPIAMRANTGKPQLSYLLSFFGGADDAFPSLEWVVWLARWYQGIEDGRDLTATIIAALETLPKDWPEQVARVAEFGAKKYARGNYLKGRPWSDTIDSLLRHLRKMDGGEETDPESGLPHYGHVAWNLLFLQHCVLTGTGEDDRLKTPCTR